MMIELLSYRTYIGNQHNNDPLQDQISDNSAALSFSSIVEQTSDSARGEVVVVGGVGKDGAPTRLFTKFESKSPCSGLSFQPNFSHLR